jgi:hypothetical protein
LYKSYLLIMYDVRQPVQLVTCTFQTCLEKDVMVLQAKRPEITNDEIIQHITKYKVLDNMASSPNRHWKQLCDLMVTVDTLGLPHFFSCLLQMRHRNLDGMIFQIWNPYYLYLANNSLGKIAKWNVFFFHRCVWSFLNEYILWSFINEYILLEQVQHYLYCYECQYKLCLHAHLML